MRLLKRLISLDIVKNIFVLFSGTVLAQLIPFVISPILTRLYSPQDFGAFSIFLSLSLVVASISTGKYELAIMLPKYQNKAFYLFVLSLMFSLVVNIFFLVLIFVFGEKITDLIKFSANVGYLYLCPMLSFFTAIYLSSQYYLNRQQAYKKITKNKIIQSSLVAAFQIVLSQIISNMGLILGYFVGVVCATMLLIRNNFLVEKKKLNKLNRKKIFTTAIIYKRFPLFFSLSYGINTFVTNIIPIILTTSFGIEYAGFYLLVQRFLGMPSSMIVSSISGVFFQKASRQKDCRKLYLALSLGLFMLGIPFTYLIYQFSPELFIYFFGKNWDMAGQISSIMAFVYWLSISTNCVAHFSIIHQKVLYNICWQLVLLLGVIIAWYFSYEDKDVLLFFKLFVIVQCCLYLIGYFYEYYLCYQQSKKEI